MVLARVFPRGVRGLTRNRYFSSQLDSLLTRGAPLDVHPEVRDALAANKPVVALETTLVTHGLPHPINLELSRSLEDIVRSTGSIPATIGIIGGRIKIGLEPLELERLADTKSNPYVAKISRRDIAPAIAMKADGGTTCSATLIFAAMAGIKVFATGGLGGVHRGGENSMDVSADLNELTRCPVGLVSAGVKSILDIGRTLEYLETLGVPVLSYKNNSEFPAFFTRRSGFKTPWSVEDPETAAKVLFTQWQLGMNNGALIGVPIPEAFEAAGAVIQKAIEQAVAESEANGISKRGKEVTPWLLNRIGELTEGKSLASNIALLKNTALIGGEIAVQHSKLMNEHRASEQGTLDHPKYHAPPTHAPPTHAPPTKATRVTALPPAKLIVIGSAAVDITAQARSDIDKSLAVNSTSPGAVSLSLGGVGRNIAEAAHRVISSHSQDMTLPVSTLLISPVGDDAFGRLLNDETRKIGMRTDGLMQSNERTAVCNMVLDGSGSLIGGVADMGIIEAMNESTALHHLRTHRPALVCIDGNLSPNTIKHVVEYCNEADIKVFFEPTSIIKSTAILPAVAATLNQSRQSRAAITFSSPNLLELARMYDAASQEPFDLTCHPTWWAVIDDFALGSEFRMNLEQLSRKNVCDHDPSRGTLSFLIGKGIAQMAMKLLPFFQNLVIKCGALGIVVAVRVSGEEIATSGWAQEQSNIHGRYIVSRGKSDKELVVLQHFPPLEVDGIVNVTGAGDSLVGSVLASLMKKPDTFKDRKSLETTIGNAQRAACLTLQSPYAVSPELSNIALL